MAESEEQKVQPEAAAGDEAQAADAAWLDKNVADELIQAQERVLRAQAELENYRKRARRELEDERRYAELPLLRDLAPVLDNVERAIQAAEKKADAATLLEGFKMVAQQLNTVMERHHLVRIEGLHQPFDPHLHQAIMQQPSSEFPADTVIGVAQTGYQLHDRVVRPAQVIVSREAAAPSANTADA